MSEQQSFHLSNCLELGQSFCSLPFLQLHINTMKNQQLCCYSRKTVTDDTVLAEVKSKMLKNEPIADYCNTCYVQEQQGKVSPRMESNKYALTKHKNSLEKAIQNFNTKPVVYDLRISNLCNLACQMCNWKSSSMIAAAENIDTRFLSWEIDVDINPQAEKIYLAGGEPFLIKKFSDLLRKVENTDCFIDINTNATVLTDHLLNELDRFNNLQFTISIDAFGDLNSKIRVNSDWDTIVTNLKILHERYSHVNNLFHVNTVLQKDNVNHLLELGQWIESTGMISNWSINELTSPENFHYSNAPFIAIPDEIFKLKLVKKNISVLKLLKSIRSNLT